MLALLAPLLLLGLEGDCLPSLGERGVAALLGPLAGLEEGRTARLVPPGRGACARGVAVAPRNGVTAPNAQHYNLLVCFQEIKEKKFSLNFWKHYYLLIRIDIL